MSPAIDRIAELSQCLHALYGSEDHDLGTGWMTARLEDLRTLVAYERAWWGECSAAQDEEPPLNWLHGSIGLAAGFAAEWNRISTHDEFAQASMDTLGQVVRSSGHDSAGAAVESFSRRHDLMHAMAITLELPGSGLLFFVSLYRGEESQAFDDEDAALLGAYGSHLARCWHLRLQQRLRAVPLACDALALCEASGKVVYLGLELARSIRDTLGQWQGEAMPPEVVAHFGERPATLRLGGKLPLAVTSCGELVAVSAAGSGASAALAPRQHAAALLYADGHSYKSIAARLGLSPATVRTYLRDAYLHLGVRNKVELGSRLTRQ